jgi:hypothetical protein
MFIITRETTCGLLEKNVDGKKKNFGTFRNFEEVRFYKIVVI